jgi:hypothetical protein
MCWYSVIASLLKSSISGLGRYYEQLGHWDFPTWECSKLVWFGSDTHPNFCFSFCFISSSCMTTILGHLISLQTLVDHWLLGHVLCMRLGTQTSTKHCPWPGVTLLCNLVAFLPGPGKLMYLLPLWRGPGSPLLKAAHTYSSSWSMALLFFSVLLPSHHLLNSLTCPPSLPSSR